MTSCLLPRILVTTAYLFRASLLAGVTLASVSCGGGGGSTSTSTTASTTPATALPAFVAYTPSAGVIASKKTVASPSFSGTPALRGPQACLATLSNNVHDQTHTTTFAGAGVSETDQQEIADYAEAAVKELRTKFSVSASIGFYGKKIEVCVQPESPNNTGAAAIALSPSGSLAVLSPSAYFLLPGVGGRNAFVPRRNNVYQQEFISRLLVHEMTHVYTDSRHVSSPNLTNELWFEEGIAEFMAWGKVNLDKARILAELNFLNPLKGPSLVNGVSNYSSLNDSVGGRYTGALAAVTFLMSPTGANNPLSAVGSVQDKLNAEFERLQNEHFAAAIAACNIQPTLPVCAAPFSLSDAQKSEVFTRVFESTFKEKDGSGMKLRSGTNNLQDTLIARITAFW